MTMIGSSLSAVSNFPSIELAIENEDYIVNEELTSSCQVSTFYCTRVMKNIFKDVHSTQVMCCPWHNENYCPSCMTEKHQRTPRHYFCPTAFAGQLSTCGNRNTLKARFSNESQPSL